MLIHPVTTIEECRSIERLQQEIWTAEPIDLVPDHLLLTMAKEGGIVLLALNETAEPMGFLLSFLGLSGDNQLKVVSHQLGVLAAYQGQGVGYQLKLAQREMALARHLTLITWTFDPLLARNAYFNLHKLGAVCRTYYRNLYGDMRNGLNQDLPSDRFRADWWIATDHVAQSLAGHFAELPIHLPIVNPITVLPHGKFVLARLLNLPTSDYCLVEIPTDIARLKAESPDLACQWQQQIRYIFEHVFALGYTVIDLLIQNGHAYYSMSLRSPKCWNLKASFEIPNFGDCAPV